MAESEQSGVEQIILKVDPDFKAAVRERARSLGQTMKQYFCALARRDIDTGGDLLVKVVPASYPPHAPQLAGALADRPRDPKPRKTRRRARGDPGKTGTSG